jgi:hypothetical protein
MNETTNGTAWRLAKLEEAVHELGRKFDRLMMAVVGASLTIAVSAIVFIITVSSGAS